VRADKQVTAVAEAKLCAKRMRDVDITWYQVTLTVATRLLCSYLVSEEVVISIGTF